MENIECDVFKMVHLKQQHSQPLVSPAKHDSPSSQRPQQVPGKNSKVKFNKYFKNNGKMSTNNKLNVYGTDCLQNSVLSCTKK